MTADAMSKCSATTGQALTFSALAIRKLKPPSKKKPHSTPIIMAVESLKRKSGTIKEEAKRNLEKKV
jgi:hypothetical protein